MAAESYKNLIIGSGEGGKFLAWHLAKTGERTAVVERRWVGGSCPNINCLPSKNEIWSARVADLARRAGTFGVKTGPVAVDMAAVRMRKRRMVDSLVAMHLERYKATGAELIMGEARLSGPLTVEVRLNGGGARTLTAERLFLNLGTHASIPGVPGLAECRPLTHIEALELDRLPEHLVVIGGGYVGLEFAQAYRRFGSRVTIIQHGPQLLAGQDPDMADEVRRMFADEGIDVVAPAEIFAVSGQSGSAATLVVRTPTGEQTVQGSDILVATGRTPNTAGIGLESAGIKLDPRGYVQVNDRLETTATNVWAIGECAGSPQFTHASFDDFRVIRDNLAGGQRTTRDRVIPSCLFTDPPVALIGLTEGEARRRNIGVRVAKLPMAAVLRTRTTGETRGFMKALVATADDRVLGFTMIGAEAGEVMAVVQAAMLAGSPFTVLRDAIFTHPTMAEGLNGLLSSVGVALAAAPQTAAAGRIASPSPEMPLVRYQTAQIDGLDIFYREAGSRNAPTVLLLHGFPSSSFMFRNLIPRLATRYHVVAPDYPGFGQSSSPSASTFHYTFDHLAQIVDQFTQALKLDRFTLYVQDYGAPIGYRIASAHPERIAGIVVQNGNAYVDGLPDGYWKPIREYWANPSPEARDRISLAALTFEGFKSQYLIGVKDPSAISPDTWTLDLANLNRPGNKDVQLDLLLDYQNNLRLYPKWQEYFRTSQPPLLIVWGKNDVCFPAPGAEAYKRDVKNLDFHLLDTGHFALEDSVQDISDLMLAFLAKHSGR